MRQASRREEPKKERQIDENALRDRLFSWFNALVYAFCVYYLAGSVLKALVVSAAAVASAYFDYGHSRRFIYPVGFGLLVVTCLVMTNVLPPPDRWLPLLSPLFERMGAMG